MKKPTKASASRSSCVSPGSTPTMVQETGQDCRSLTTTKNREVWLEVVREFLLSKVNDQTIKRSD
jgi:hypothetical protein